MTFLVDSSLDFARAHVDAFGDSDFFPPRDEFVAINAGWDAIKQYLTASNVEKLPVEAPRSMPAPKARGGYRIVHQLESLGALTYTALAHMVAGQVEVSRVPASIAFSYRLSVSANSFFASGNGYQPFVSRCRDLAGTHAFVFAADIADFYNRTYVHRVENAITSAGCPGNLGKALEHFLLALNGKNSQGIPVGPAASIVMAEAVMTDRDQFIGNYGLQHARYVDDFRIFSSSRDDLERFEEQFVQHLFEIHRLQLAPGKTSITETASFADRIGAPAEVERRELLELAQAVCDYGDQYTLSDIEALAQKFLEPTKPRARPAASGWWQQMLRAIDRHEERERETIRNGLISELFEEGLRKTPLDLGLVRHALRQGSRWGSPNMIGPVLRNIAFIEPALPDAFTYLNAVYSDDLAEEHIDAIRALVQSQGFKRSRFVQHWTYWFLTSKPRLVADAALGPKIWNDSPVEWQARAARTTRNLAKVRQHKSALGSFGLWDRRSLLMSSEVMPALERAAWLGSITPRDPVEQSIVRWAKAKP